MRLLLTPELKFLNSNEQQEELVDFTVPFIVDGFFMEEALYKISISISKDLLSHGIKFRPSNGKNWKFMVKFY